MSSLSDMSALSAGASLTQRLFAARRELEAAERDLTDKRGWAERKGIDPRSWISGAEQRVERAGIALERLEDEHQRMLRR
jgi:hypothetical protein